MIDPTQRLHNPALASAFVSDSSRNQATRSQSFTAALADELGKRSSSASDSENLPSNLALVQQYVTRRDPGATSGSTSASTPASTPTAPTQPSGLNGLVITFPNPATGPAPVTTSVTASDTQASPTSTESFDQAYWASQPAPVQQLQNIQDPTQRAEAASQLAQEGYSIDVPIMVWGWDPQITTQARQSMGYTWVPSALQQPVEVAPGLTFNGASYNPSNPPAGSIPV